MFLISASVIISTNMLNLISGQPRLVLHHSAGYFPIYEFTTPPGTSIIKKTAIYGQIKTRNFLRDYVGQPQVKRRIPILK